jgi:hypothetical protein
VGGQPRLPDDTLAAERRWLSASTLRRMPMATRRGLSDNGSPTAALHAADRGTPAESAPSPGPGHPVQAARRAARSACTVPAGQSLPTAPANPSDPAYPTVPAVRTHPTALGDPDVLQPEQCLLQLAAILATGVVRMRAQRAATVPAVRLSRRSSRGAGSTPPAPLRGSGISEESGDSRLEVSERSGPDRSLTRGVPQCGTGCWATVGLRPRPRVED